MNKVSQDFLVTITTDGMDYPSDMQGIAKAIQAAVPDIVRKYVNETAPAKVEWFSRKRMENLKKRKKAR